MFSVIVLVHTMPWGLRTVCCRMPRQSCPGPQQRLPPHSQRHLTDHPPKHWPPSGALAPLPRMPPRVAISPCHKEPIHNIPSPVWADREDLVLSGPKIPNCKVPQHPPSAKPPGGSKNTKNSGVLVVPSLTPECPQLLCVTQSVTRAHACTHISHPL